jgi:WD40 repeat protein
VRLFGGFPPLPCDLPSYNRKLTRVFGGPFLSAPEPGTHRSWSDISARVTSLAFSPSGSHLAASSLDESIRIYSVKSPSTILSLKNLCVFSHLAFLILSLSLSLSCLVVSRTRTPFVNCGLIHDFAYYRHRGGANKVVWAGEDQVVSAGADGMIRTLQVKTTA